MEDQQCDGYVERKNALMGLKGFVILFPYLDLRGRGLCLETTDTETGPSNHTTLGWFYRRRDRKRASQCC